MSIPTFNGAALFHAAARDAPAAAEARVQYVHLPGVDGAQVRLHGAGVRRVVAEGILAGSMNGGASVSPGGAHQKLKELLRSLQDTHVGRAVAVYVGTDGVALANCVLAAYELTGPAQITRLGESSYDAIAPARAEVVHLGG